MGIFMRPTLCFLMSERLILGFISKRFEHLFTFQNVFDIITSYNYDQHSGLGSPSGPGIGISAHMMKLHTLLRHIIMMNQKS